MSTSYRTEYGVGGVPEAGDGESAEAIEAEEEEDGWRGVTGHHGRACHINQQTRADASWSCDVRVTASSRRPPPDRRDRDSALASCQIHVDVQT